jgi:galactofuranose transport system permease protein
MTTANSPIRISTRPRGALAWFNPSWLPVLATLLVIGAMLAIGGYAYTGFLSSKALADLLNGNAYLGICAIGATVVILSGGIDLSIGSVIACTTILMATLTYPSVAQQLAIDPSLDPAQLVHGGGMHPGYAALISIIVGTLFGLAMGAMIAVYELPPFMVTLAGMFLARAMGHVILNASLGSGLELGSIAIDHPFYAETLPDLRWHVADTLNRRNKLIPVYIQPTAVLMLGAFVIAMIVLHLTSFGRNIYAIGGDETSAKLMGIRVNRTKMFAYAVSGLCASIAGVVASIDRRAGNPSDFVGVELEAIAAVVIGGTLLTGGRGLVIGTFLGSIVLGLIQAFVPFSTWKWLDAQTTPILIGALMLLFILMQGGFNALGRRLGRT